MIQKPIDMTHKTHGDSNYSATQTYTCLKGYSDGDASRHHAGYLQGVQGIELKGGHIQQFIKGYFDGLHGYWWNRGLVEGYSGLPMSLHNKNYTDAYKSEAAETAAGYPCTKKAGFDLGFLPAHTNDNYRDFYLGLDQGGDAYDMVDGTHYFLYKPPPGHTSEYRDGWKFGYSLGLVFDADCPSTTTTSPTPQQNGTTTESNKTSISTYQSGYEHGISDAKKVIQGSKDLYILQPGKGWTDHTGQFIQADVVGLNSTANMPRGWRAGYDYANNEWSQHIEDNPPHSFECPLSKLYRQSNFCIGYDAALAYQNSDM